METNQSNSKDRKCEDMKEEKPIKSLEELKNLPHKKICAECGEEFHCIGDERCGHCCHCYCLTCFVMKLYPASLSISWDCWGIEKGSEVWKTIVLLVKIMGGLKYE